KLLGLFRGELVLAPRMAELAELRSADGDAWIGVIDDAERARVFALSQAALASERRCVTLLVGPAGLGKERVARALAAATGHERVLAVDFRRLGGGAAELVRALADLGREATMLGAALVLTDVPPELDAATSAAVRSALDR